jgi:hypothetical protein
MYSHTISASIVKPQKGTNQEQSQRFNVVFDDIYLTNIITKLCVPYFCIHFIHIFNTYFYDD